MSHSEELSDLRGLTDLPSLTTLDLSSCSQLRDLGGLANLSSLTTLNLSYRRQLSDLSVLAHLPKLETLYAWGLAKPLAIPEEVRRQVEIHP